KRCPVHYGQYTSSSLPRGSADRNILVQLDRQKQESRSLAGARIETCPRRRRRTVCTVAPSRERGSKLREASRSGHSRRVAPSRERGSKRLVWTCEVPK